MASKNKIYTVHAKRWGEHETHSYIVGVFSKKEKALKAAAQEEEWRGGKYSCEVIEWDLDVGINGRDFDDRPYNIIQSPKYMR